ncbi:hypothetical protein J2Y69_002766 [Microbacterium resistens]|uniref:Uncharacterized protein n=1 Tax=Microbacterium resistens TaxID=156977 RepID=A0ABU1SEY7_9MICO|nr:hypothetical protein [Microbacterium resistens]MDR6868155.1 hypothetical protein [Microbacterium resistens]
MTGISGEAMGVELVEQPKWSDDVSDWRRYAGELRSKIGDLNRLLSVEREQQRILRNSKGRDAKLLTKVERFLADGDVPAAVDLLARRRQGIDAAKAGRT